MLINLFFLTDFINSSTNRKKKMVKPYNNLKKSGMICQVLENDSLYTNKGKTKSTFKSKNDFKCFYFTENMRVKAFNLEFEKSKKDFYKKMSIKEKAKYDKVLEITNNRIYHNLNYNVAKYWDEYKALIEFINDKKNQSLPYIVVETANHRNHKIQQGNIMITCHRFTGFSIYKHSVTGGIIAIHESSYVDDDFEWENGIVISKNCKVGKGVSLKEHTLIAEECYICDFSKIGKYCILMNNVIIEDPSFIKDKNIFLSGVKIIREKINISDDNNYFSISIDSSFHESQKNEIMNFISKIKNSNFKNIIGNYNFFSKNCKIKSSTILNYNFFDENTNIETNTKICTGNKIIKSGVDIKKNSKIAFYTIINEELFYENSFIYNFYNSALQSHKCEKKTIIEEEGDLKKVIEIYNYYYMKNHLTIKNFVENLNSEIEDFLVNAVYILDGNHGDINMF